MTDTEKLLRIKGRLRLLRLSDKTESLIYKVKFYLKEFVVSKAGYKPQKEIKITYVHFKGALINRELQARLSSDFLFLVCFVFGRGREAGNY